MIICGLKNGENVSKDLYKGTLEQCRAWCKSAVPADYDSLNICEDSGVIVFRIVNDGRQAKDYLTLLEPETMDGLISRDEILKLYEKSLERAKGYMNDPKLYDVHRYYCLQFAKLAGIDEKTVLEELQDEVDRRRL